MNALLEVGQAPTGKFAGCHYSGHSKVFTIQLANVPAEDSRMIASLVAFWTDPAHAPNLAKLKAGDGVLELGTGELRLITADEFARALLRRN